MASEINKREIIFNNERKVKKKRLSMMIQAHYMCPATSHVLHTFCLPSRRGPRPRKRPSVPCALDEAQPAQILLSPRDRVTQSD